MIKDAWDIGKDIIEAIKSLDENKRKQVLSYLKKRWQGFAFIGVILLACFISYEYAINSPERIVKRFYQGIDDKNYQESWNLVEENYRVRKWTDDIQKFTEGYDKTINHPRLLTHLLGESNGVAVVYARATAIEEQSPGINKYVDYCLAYRLRKVSLPNTYQGYISVFWAKLTNEDWRIILISWHKAKEATISAKWLETTVIISFQESM